MVTLGRRSALALLATSLLEIPTRDTRAEDTIVIGISGAYTGADSANSFAPRNGALRYLYV